MKKYLLIIGFISVFINSIYANKVTIYNDWTYADNYQNNSISFNYGIFNEHHEIVYWSKNDKSNLIDYIGSKYNDNIKCLNIIDTKGKAFEGVIVYKHSNSMESWNYYQDGRIVNDGVINEMC